MYEVEAFKERLFSSTLNPQKLAEVLNRRADAGWQLARHITSTSRMWLIFKREVHFLIFERA